MHKSAPYKISSVHIAFARKSVTAGAMRLTHMLRNSLLINNLALCWLISSVGMHRALVQCERGLGPSPNGMSGAQGLESRIEKFSFARRVRKEPTTMNRTSLVFL